MINRENFEKVSNRIPISTFQMLKRDLYFELNRSLTLIREKTDYVEVNSACFALIKEMFTEMSQEKYPVDMYTTGHTHVLRLYLEAEH